MPSRASRQSRLPLERHRGDEASRLANYRVLRRPYLSATALASYGWCNVKPFIERVTAALGLDTETQEMRAGARAHDHLQGALEAVAAPSELTLAQALARSRFQFAAEYPLSDPRRRLRGIADLVHTARGQAYVLELKNTYPPRAADAAWGARVWYEHGLQAHFYGLLARGELGQEPHLALAYLKDRRKEAVLERLARDGDPEAALEGLWATSARLENNLAARSRVLETVRAFRAAERGRRIPERLHDDPDRCRRCRVRSWCPRRLDAPGRFEALDAGLLDEAR